MDPYRHISWLEDELKKLSLSASSANFASSMLGQMASVTRQLEADWRRGIESPLLDELEAHQRTFLEMPGSLMKLRANEIYRSKLSQAALAVAKEHRNYTGISITDTQLNELARYTASSEVAAKASDYIYSVLNEGTRKRITDLTKPFNEIQEQAQLATNALAGIADSADWARKLGVQMIDAASISAVASTWAMEDALRSLEDVAGINRTTIQHLATALDLEFYVDEQRADGDETSAGYPTIANHGRFQLPLGTVLAIISIILTLIIREEQIQISEQTEARLHDQTHAQTEQLRDDHELFEQKIDYLSRLVEQLVEEFTLIPGVQFVALSRGAMVKVEKRSSAVIGEVLPGQVVDLTAHEGKWIGVRYFDFAAQEQRTGWTLKKYFVRIQNANTMIVDQEGGSASSDRTSCGALVDQ